MMYNNCMYVCIYIYIYKKSDLVCVCVCVKMILRTCCTNFKGFTVFSKSQRVSRGLKWFNISAIGTIELVLIPLTIPPKFRLLYHSCPCKIFQ